MPHIHQLSPLRLILGRVVDLRFDDNTGRACRFEYYDVTKERNMENFIILYPKYLRWDSIFKLMFGLAVDANMERTKPADEIGAIRRCELNRKPTKELLKKYTSIS